MVNFLSEKCYLKFHVGEDKPNQGKTRTKERKKKQSPNKNHSKARLLLIGPRKRIRPTKVHYRKCFFWCIDVSHFFQKLKPPHGEHVCVIIHK